MRSCVSGAHQVDGVLAVERLLGALVLPIHWVVLQPPKLDVNPLGRDVKVAAVWGLARAPVASQLSRSPCG
jgi:hypothetical protein